MTETSLRLFEKGAGYAWVPGYARLPSYRAVIAEGPRVKGPAGLARRINELMVRDAAG